jgi:uncharacterized membrane protein YbhN (UPF0104 family)
VLLIILLGFLYIFIHCYRFKIILEKCSGIALSFQKWFKIFIQARFLNLVIPQSGNIYRGIALKNTFNLSYTDYISAFTSFAWMDTCFNLIIATIIVSLFANRFVIGKCNAVILLASMTLVIISTPFIGRFIFSKINIRHPKIAWLKSKLNEVLDTSLCNLKDLKYMSLITLTGLATLVRTVLVYYILFRSFGVKPDIYILIIFYSLFKLSAFIAITPGNIGVQEIAFGFLSKYAGTGMAQGIMVSVIGRVLGTLIILICGVAAGGIDLLRNQKYRAGKTLYEK